MRKPLSPIVGPLLAYLALSLLLTWPLAAHFTSHVPGDGIDDPSLAWNLWWIKHALVDRPQNPFACDWQFWPVGINLAFYTLTILNGLLGVPLQVVFGLIPAYNLLLLSSFVLGGFGAYLLCKDFLERVQGRNKTWQIISSPCHLVTLSSFVGGALYAFASARLFYAALGQGNIASAQWAPFAALYILRAARPTGRPRDAFMAALFLVFQAYAELTYASFLLLFVGLAFIWGVYRHIAEARSHSISLRPTTNMEKRSPSNGSTSRFTHYSSLATRFALFLFLFVLGITPFLANMLPDLRSEGDFFTSGGGFADLFSADLAGYALPTQLHPVLGRAIRAMANDSAPRADGSQWPVNKGQHIYLGYTALALAAVGFWRGRARRSGRGWPAETWFWAVAAAFFFLLTLGPSLRVAGHDLGIPLPFALIEKLPFFKGNRYPSRYSVMSLMSLAPLVSLGTAALLERRPTTNDQRSAFVVRRSSFAGLLVLILFEHLSVPLPLFDLRVPALYEQVAAQAGDFALLELPPGWRNGARVVGKQDIVIMQELWNQTAHSKRVLGGNTSRNPEFKFQYFSEDPTLARLIAQTNAADLPQHTALRGALAASAITEADRTRAREWAAFLDLRYVMVHRDKLPAETEATLRALLPVRLIGEEGDLALYELPADLPRPREFAVGTDQGQMVLAEGWSPACLLADGAAADENDPPAPPILGETGSPQSWGAGGAISGLAVYAQRQEARLLLPLPTSATTLRFYGRSMVPGQVVTVVVDGRVIASQPFPQEWGWLTFAVAADPGRPPLSDVRLRFSALIPVVQLSSGAGPVSVLARSAGQETGDFAHIYVNGTDLSPNRRGYNLVALDPGDGRLLDTAAFDTHADPDAGARLAAWVSKLPLGAIVAVAARDEGSMNLGEEAVAALRTLGAAVDLRGHFRWGHALIGTVGARAGTALEELDGVRPAQVSVGLPVSAPEVAAALVQVKVGQ